MSRQRVSRKVLVSNRYDLVLARRNNARRRRISQFIIIIVEIDKDKATMKRSRLDSRAFYRKKPPIVFAACILFAVQCYGFQNLHKRPQVGCSVFKSTTSLQATKNRRRTATTTPKKTSTTTIVKSAVESNKRKKKKGNSRMLAGELGRRVQPQDGVSMSRHVMLQHDILSAEEEQALGRKIKRSIQLKAEIAKLCEKKLEQQQEQHLEEDREVAFLNQMTDDLLLDDHEIGFLDDYDGDQTDLDNLSVYGIIESNEMRKYDRGYRQSRDDGDEIEYDDFSLINEGDSLSPSGVIASAYPDNNMLTETDIVEELGIAGGRKELTKILLDGDLARDTMISSNVRLVVSIAKKWCLKGSANSANPGDQRLKSIYAGSWTKPSLDEAIQEGIVGLANAADRFEPERKLKFGTYATYWITNSVRKCFQNAATGCLRVPPHYHVLQQQYHKFVKQRYRDYGIAPSTEAAAEELGISESRLEFILRTTQPLISMDEPAPAGIVPSRGGSAGAVDVSSESLILSNTIAW